MKFSFEIFDLFFQLAGIVPMSAISPNVYRQPSQQSSELVNFDDFHYFCLTDLGLEAG